MNLNDTVVLELTIVLKSKIKNMKKINLKNAENALSREEMKNVFAGREASLGICDDWATKEKSICYNCCITVKSLDFCATKCGF